MLSRERVRFESEIEGLREHNALVTTMFHNVRRKLEGAVVEPAKPKPMRAGSAAPPYGRSARPWRTAPPQHATIHGTDEQGRLGMCLDGIIAEASDDGTPVPSADDATLSSWRGGSEPRGSE